MAVVRPLSPDDTQVIAAIGIRLRELADEFDREHAQLQERPAAIGFGLAVDVVLEVSQLSSIALGASRIG